MSPATRSLVDVEDVRSRIDELLARHVAQLRTVLAAASDDADVLADAVAQMLSGGKRLRAAFCYWSWRAHGGQPGTPAADAVLRVGAALELFQAAALFHDDVMDDSDTRRGFPAAHRAFAQRHGEQALTGDAERFGMSAAILLGDLTLIASEQEFAGALALQPVGRAERARVVFDLMRTEVTVGQYLDVLAQAMPWGDDPAGDEVRAREVIRAKAARYSVEHPIVLGASLADASEDDLEACRALGLPLGEAFQLRDDLLGVFGDPRSTGKPAGDDLREGKRTILTARAVARARARGDDATVHLLRDRLGDRALSEADVTVLADAIAGTGAPDDVELLIADLAGRAFTLMDARPWVDPARSQLIALAHAAVDRHA
ncbi:polyprenyl synthetase family protein [Cellulomonas fengjieae]|uniref:Polyprenyl synthetase family protein n=1 Tax=Cellulomonas fengjieae TaxID=2819978 RepID=A0ABS3SEV2_9CELL|nr:polyprenyl synthetase family protein [Cellulomonas fengjieae]MBO3084182.1 polyprenyl synthetase family protein [Cellulomonas fengjieae]MBO3103598.1 polyprenyl synthetase family protein [Cellulomonas fengjieae]QVI64572.1 polyprenyl synthetase family protein [Cellulomonas fengjieae]